MDLRIVPQRLKVTNADGRSLDRFPVEDRARAKRNIQFKTVVEQAAQDLSLYVAHEPHIDLPVLSVPFCMELWVLRGQLLKRAVGRVWVLALGQQDLIGTDGLEGGGGRGRGVTKYLARRRLGKTGHRAQRSGRHLVHGLEFISRVKTELVYFFFPSLVPGAAPQEGAYL